MPASTNTKAFELTEFDYRKVTATERTLGQTGPREVRVRMKAASLNFRDYLIAQGLYNPHFELPLVPLSDGAGEVVEVGEEVTRFRQGDRVVSTFMQDWVAGPITTAAAASALGGEIDGVLQAERLFPDHALVRIPDGLSFEAASTLPCAALTAWNALFETGSVRPGDKVLVLGTGGVSIFALQFAKAAGARVFATSSSDDKLTRARKLGADHTVNYKSTPDWEKSILEEADGEGVDHVIEVGGAGTLDKSIKSVRRGGHISLIGVLAGGGKVDPIKVLMKAIRLQGIFVGSREMFERMVEAVDANAIEPVIDKTFAVDDVSDAIEYLSAGKHFGKIVLTF